MSNQSVTWLILFIVVAVSILVTIYTVYEHKREIRKSLEKKGAKNISVTWQPLDFDKSNQTYSVTYDDTNNKRVRTECKIHNFGETIYWRDQDNE